MNGPCLCGDPYCRRCFPSGPGPDDDDVQDIAEAEILRMAAEDRAAAQAYLADLSEEEINSEYQQEQERRAANEIPDA